MRFLLLYARSRQIPAALAAAVALMAVVALLGRNHAAASAAFAVAGGAALLGFGLGGPDDRLENTAARRWAPRRAAHLAAIAFVTAAVVLVCTKAPAGLVVRDAAGFAGLAALAARLLGGRLAWAPPVAAGAAAVVLPALPEPFVIALLTWPAQPAGNGPAAATAAIFAVLGGALYAARGARDRD
ncbi:hypothetical protein [Micromonospora avicenniae]|uniref:hypothetical protein n=1 Tax=Micromonospora avicenniae TaxID=1198245 RepID=UPI00332DB131